MTAQKKPAVIGDDRLIFDMPQMPAAVTLRNAYRTGRTEAAFKRLKEVT
jgi:hypothetical protein